MLAKAIVSVVMVALTSEELPSKQRAMAVLGMAAVALSPMKHLLYAPRTVQRHESRASEVE